MQHCLEMLMSCQTGGVENLPPGIPAAEKYIIRTDVLYRPGPGGNQSMCAARRSCTHSSHQSAECKVVIRKFVLHRKMWRPSKCTRHQLHAVPHAVLHGTCNPESTSRGTREEAQLLAEKGVSCSAS